MVTAEEFRHVQVLQRQQHARVGELRKEDGQRDRLGLERHGSKPQALNHLRADDLKDHVRHKDECSELVADQLSCVLVQVNVATGGDHLALACLVSVAGPR